MTQNSWSRKHAKQLYFGNRAYSDLVHLIIDIRKSYVIDKRHQYFWGLIYACFSVYCLMTTFKSSNLFGYLIDLYMYIKTLFLQIGQKKFPWTKEVLVLKKRVDEDR